MRYQIEKALENDYAGNKLDLTNNQSQIQPTAPNGVEYKNEKFEFELSFPATWKGFTTSDRTVDLLNNKTRGFETNKAIDVIYEDKPLFVIVIVLKDKWKDYDHLVDKYLGENDKYAFSYYINWEPEPDVVDRLNEIEAIGKTFKAMK